MSIMLMSNFLYKDMFILNQVRMPVLQTQYMIDRTCLGMYVLSFYRKCLAITVTVT